MELKSTRDGWGEGLVELGKSNSKVVVLTADVKESTRVEEFAKLFPERFIECGVAEQNMMGVAAGLAAAGKVPFVSSYAVFSPGRNWDQFRVSVCYSNLPVIVGGHHTGLATGVDGATHQALEDIAITRCLPNLAVWVPADFEEAKQMTIRAASYKGPVYIRLTREKSANITDKNSNIEILKAKQIRNTNNQFSNKVAIIGAGPVLNECLLAAEELEKENIGSVVINNSSIKPIDNETIINVARECGAVVTVEDHQIYGGIGSAIAELLVASCQLPPPMEMVGVKNTFGESGKLEELWEKYGLTAKYIVEAAKRVIARKA